MSKFETAQQIIDNKVSEFYLTSWKANGYDDSDGDVLTYDAKEDVIRHHEWTPRFYYPRINMVTKDKCPSWKLGVEAGVFTKEHLKKVLFEDTFRYFIKNGLNETLLDYMKRGLAFYANTHRYADIDDNICLPVLNYKGELVYISSIIDVCGSHRQESVVLNVYNPFTKEYSENVSVRTVKFTDEAFERMGFNLGELFYDTVTVEELFDLISSMNTCSSAWVGDDIINIIVSAIKFPEEGVTAKIEFYKEFIAKKTKKLEDWADKKFKNADESVKAARVEAAIKNNYYREYRIATSVERWAEEEKRREETIALAKEIIAKKRKEVEEALIECGYSNSNGFNDEELEKIVEYMISVSCSYEVNTLLKLCNEE